VHHSQIIDFDHRAVYFIFVLIFGSLFAKFFEPETIEGSDPIDLVSSLVVAPDISIYSGTAIIIIVGEVSEVIDRPNANNVLDAKIKVDEVLKGDPDINSVTVMMIGTSKNEWIEDSVMLTQGEKVLLFLGTNGEGDYVVLGGAVGKALIDENNNVIGEPVFTMPLEELKAKIKDAL